MASLAGRKTDIPDILCWPRCWSRQGQATPGELWCRRISLCIPPRVEPRILLSLCCFLGNSWSCLGNSYFSRGELHWKRVSPDSLFADGVCSAWVVESYVLYSWLKADFPWAYNQHKVYLSYLYIGMGWNILCGHLSRRTGWLCCPPQPRWGLGNPGLRSTRCSRQHSVGTAALLPQTTPSSTPASANSTWWLIPVLWKYRLRPECWCLLDLLHQPVWQRHASAFPGWEWGHQATSRTYHPIFRGFVDFFGNNGRKKRIEFET